MYSRNFQITAEKKSAPIFDLPFGTVMTKLELFHVVEKKMYHARQTFEINWAIPENIRNPPMNDTELGS